MITRVSLARLFLYRVRVRRNFCVVSWRRRCATHRMRDYSSFSTKGLNAKHVHLILNFCCVIFGWQSIVCSIPAPAYLEHRRHRYPWRVCCLCWCDCYPCNASFWRYQGPWSVFNSADPQFKFFYIQTKVQVRTEERYHGFLRTIRTIWNVCICRSPDTSRLIMCFLIPATWYHGIFWWRISAIITQSVEFRHRLGCVWGCFNVPTDFVV